MPNIEYILNALNQFLGDGKREFIFCQAMEQLKENPSEILIPASLPPDETYIHQDSETAIA